MISVLGYYQQCLQSVPQHHGDNPAHLQETMSFGVQSMFELAHILVLLRINVIIWEVYGEPFQDKFHFARLCITTSSVPWYPTCSQLRGLSLKCTRIATETLHLTAL